MTITYDEQTWVNGVAGGTPLSAQRLQHIEDGLAAVTTEVNGKQAAGDYVTTPELNTTLGSYASAASQTALGDRLDTSIAAIATLPGTYGDVATTDVDITPALQAAYDSLPDTGGRIVFPPGQRLRFNGTLHISKDNIIFDFNGSTLFKDTASEFGAFYMHSFRGTGYGAGPRMCKFLNGKIEGDFADKRGFALQIHHAENLLFENMIFSQGMVAAHYVELAGCRRVKFKNCTFEGCIPGSPTDTTDHAWYNESVQLDYSYFDGVALEADNLDRYDGLPCKDVTFDNCQWLPLTVGGVTYPAPMITGQHVRMEGQWIENIKMKHCYAEGLQPTWQIGGTTGGWIHGYGFRNWKIKDCTFVNTAGEGATVFLADGTTGATGFPLNTATLTGATPATAPIDPMPSEDITIEDCTFRGFTGTGTDRTQIIVIKGYNGSQSGYPNEIHGAGIKINNNFIDATHPTSPPDNTLGQRFCGIYYMDGVTFNGNEGRQNGQVLWIGNVTGFSIADNTFPAVYDEAFVVYTACTQGAVKGNTIYGAGAFRIDGASKVTVSGNTFGYLTSGYKNYVVNITGTPSGIVITGNTIDTKGSAAAYGLQVVNGGANVVVTNNGACTSLAMASAFNFASGVQNANNYLMAA